MAVNCGRSAESLFSSLELSGSGSLLLLLLLLSSSSWVRGVLVVLVEELGDREWNWESGTGRVRGEEGGEVLLGEEEAISEARMSRMALTERTRLSWMTARHARRSARHELVENVS